MANLQIILQELREFRRENAETLREIREDVKATKNRAEMRISETEERLQVKFSSSKTKEEILKQVWRKKGFLYQEKKVDHDSLSQRGGEQQPEAPWDGFKKKLDTFRRTDR